MESRSKIAAHLITLFEGLCFKWFLLVAQVALSLLCLESPCVCHIIQPQTHTHTTCVSRHKREKRREERREREKERGEGSAAVRRSSFGFAYLVHGREKQQQQQQIEVEEEVEEEEEVGRRKKRGQDPSSLGHFTSRSGRCTWKGFVEGLEKEKG